MITNVRNSVEQLTAISAYDLHYSHVKNVTLQKIGPDGVSLAERVYLDYSKVSMDNNGNVVGGSVSQRSVYQETDCSTGSVRFGSDGSAEEAQMTVFDKRIGGVHRIVTSDLTGLRCLFGRLIDGELKTTSLRSDGFLASKGSITFNEEKILKADFDLYARDGTGTLDRRSSLDFSRAEMQGECIVGGSILMSSWLANGALIAEGRSTFGLNGLPTKFSQTVYSDTTPGIVSIVEIDYTNVQFDALKDILAGTLTITANRPGGTVACYSQLTYIKGVPSAYHADCYDAHGALNRKVSISYAGVTFNHGQRPINSIVTVQTFDPKEKLVSNVDISYSSEGDPVSKKIRSYTSDGDIVSVMDCRRAVYDTRHVIVNGQTTTTTIANGLQVDVVRTYTGTRRHATKERRVIHVATGSLRKWSRAYYRPDGTALKVVKNEMDNAGRLKYGKVIYFATDGKTIISRKRLKYADISSQAGLPGGDVILSTFNGRGQKRSHATVSFW